MALTFHTHTHHEHTWWMVLFPCRWPPTLLVIYLDPSKYPRKWDMTRKTIRFWLEVGCFCPRAVLGLCSKIANSNLFISFSLSFSFPSPVPVAFLGSFLSFFLHFVPLFLDLLSIFAYPEPNTRKSASRGVDLFDQVFFPSKAERSVVIGDSKPGNLNRIPEDSLVQPDPTICLF